jgi:hypothetical protein
MEQIDLTVARQMVERYQATRKELIDSTYKIDDTKSVWFDIETFKAYVNNLPEKTTGVRVYLAAYDDQTSPTPSQTTVVFVGTESDGTDNIDALQSGNNAPDTGLGTVNNGKPCPPYCP